MKVIIMLCTNKIFSGQTAHFGPKNGTSHNSGLAQKFFLNFAEWKGLIGT